MLVLSRSDVDALIADVSPDELVQLMADVFRRVSGCLGVDLPHRLSVQTDSHNTLFMPSRVDTYGTAVKVVSVPTFGGQNGLPGTTLVMDEASGGVKAVVNSRNLTAVRTAAGASFHQRTESQGRNSFDTRFSVGYSAGFGSECIATPSGRLWRWSSDRRTHHPPSPALLWISEAMHHIQSLTQCPRGKPCRVAPTQIHFRDVHLSKNTRRTALHS